MKTTTSRTTAQSRDERFRGGRGDLTSEALTRQLERILSSARFHRSERMRRFLRFLVEHALEHVTTPSAQQIGTHVFDRPDLDSRTDPIVRVEARRLRKLLAEYYSTEGAHDHIEIMVPSPGYEPTFRWNTTRRTTVPKDGLRKCGPTKSIAVLPFLNMTNDPDQESFCEGVTEELINALTRIDDLKVAARTSTFQYKDPRDIRDIGEELGVSAVLEGSIRLVGDRVRVTAQLSSSSDGFHLWSKTFDATFEKSFTLQEQLASQIATVTGQSLQITNGAMG